jgi:hypothetical protein
VGNVGASLELRGIRKDRLLRAVEDVIRRVGQLG